MKVEITETKLHRKCLKTGNVFEIQHPIHKGKDMTSLAKIAAKCSWFEVDNPQFKPKSIQDAEPLDNGRIKILV